VTRRVPGGTNRLGTLSHVDARVEQNRTNWDDRVAVHLASAFYDVDGWLERAPGPRPEELAALGDLEGRSVVQLQCHFGMDTLQFARVGASVAGVDFSAPAIAAADELATRAGLADRARFVCGDVTEAPALLGGERFDVVYVSLGSLCWLPSITAWADAVAGVLAPGGRLYVFDGHPLVMCLDDDGERVVHGYFEEPHGRRDDFEYTYTDGERLAHTTTYEWSHGIAELLGALRDRGLALHRFEEHDWTPFHLFPWLVEATPHRWTFPEGRPRVPLSMTVVADATW
jgi:SAM-dependent methyltransferase